MTQFTLCHLSDVHLTPMPSLGAAGIAFKQALGLVNWRLKRHKLHDRATLDKLMRDVTVMGPDHILVSGDLVNISHPSEMAAARTWLEGLGGAADVSVVPGNHDTLVARPPGDGFERWAAWMTGEPVEGLETPGLEAAARGAGRAAAFPFVRRRGPLALVGISSSVPTPPFHAQGWLGEQQLHRLETTLRALSREGLFRVVAVHHPPLPGQMQWRCCLRDAERLQDVLRTAGAELVLHGHKHERMEAAVAVPGGTAPVLGISSASTRSGTARRLAAYRLIAFHWASRKGGREADGKARIEVTTRGLAEAGGPVCELAFDTYDVAQPSAQPERA